MALFGINAKLYTTRTRHDVKKHFTRAGPKHDVRPAAECVAIHAGRRVNVPYCRPQRDRIARCRVHVQSPVCEGRGNGEADGCQRGNV